MRMSMHKEAKENTKGLQELNKAMAKALSEATQEMKLFQVEGSRGWYFSLPKNGKNWTSRTFLRLVLEISHSLNKAL